MSEKYIIDRVEGSYAIAQKENGEIYQVSVKDIKGDFKEGDILIKINEYFEIDEAATLTRRKLVEEVARDIWEE